MRLDIGFVLAEESHSPIACSTSRQFIPTRNGGLYGRTLHATSGGPTMANATATSPKPTVIFFRIVVTHPLPVGEQTTSEKPNAVEPNSERQVSPPDPLERLVEARRAGAGELDDFPFRNTVAGAVPNQHVRIVAKPTWLAFVKLAKADWCATPLFRRQGSRRSRHRNLGRSAWHRNGAPTVIYENHHGGGGLLVAQ